MSRRLCFPVPEEVVGSFFDILFGLNTYLAYVSKLEEEGVAVYNYLFTSQRESHSIPDRDFFCYTIAYFVPF